MDYGEKEFAIKVIVQISTDRTIRTISEFKESIARHVSAINRVTLLLLNTL